MGLRNFRTLRDFEPDLGKKDGSNDRTRLTKIELGTQKGSFTKNIFRAPDWVKITRVSLVVSAAVPSFNESFWTFQLRNESHINWELLPQPPQSTTSAPLLADTDYDVLPTQNQVLAPKDVMSLQALKTGSPTILNNLIVFVEYEVSSVTTTTSSSTTSSTTITTSTSSTTSTTTSTTTSSSTSTSSTTVTTTSSTTSTTTTVTTTSTSSTTTISTTTSSSTSSSTSTTLSTTTTVT